ncbi:hypothetical protein Ancab_008893 [Ancistrocladus abbreviatus]
MGREWYNWAPKSSRKSGGRGGAGDGGAAGVKGGQKNSVPPPSAAGCMSTLLHLFDFHHFQFCLHQPHAFQPTPSLPEDPTSLKGVEAPRNSLESDEVAIGTSSLASITEEEGESFNDNGTQLGIQINASRRDTKLRVQASRAKGDDLSSESSCSPGPRTPNLVARLMGLDHLPEGCSSTPNNVTPRSSLSHHHLQQHQQNQQKSLSMAIRSLPETPRVVSSSARKSDVDHDSRHRLSLQIINKENRMMNEELELSRHSCSAISTKSTDWKLELEENKSPSHYARQILKQVKESVLSRRFGVEITNPNGRRELRRDEHLLYLKDKKPQKNGAGTVNQSSPVKGAMQSRFPRPQPLESKGKTAVPAAPKDHLHQPPKPSSSSSLSLSSQSHPPLLVQKQQCSRLNNSCKNGSSCVKRMPQRTVDSIRNKKDEVFVHPTAAAASRSASNSSGNKSRKATRLPSELLPASVPNFVVPLKKLEDKSTLPATVRKKKEASKAQPPKVTQLSSYSSCTASTTTTATSITTTCGWVEFQYITRILECIGIDKDTPVSFTKWSSPSQPLNPSIFDHLEHFYYSSTNTTSGHDPTLLSLKCNRKLLFELVDEILVDILKPPNHTNSKTRGGYTTRHNGQICGYQLVKLLCTRMRSLTSANCQVLQDIDSLVERDLPKLAQGSQVAIQEESEALVMEIERNILESLVQDLTLH